MRAWETGGDYIQVKSSCYDSVHYTGITCKFHEATHNSHKSTETQDPATVKVGYFQPTSISTLSLFQDSSLSIT